MVGKKELPAGAEEPIVGKGEGCPSAPGRDSQVNCMAISPQKTGPGMARGSRGEAGGERQRRWGEGRGRGSNPSPRWGVGWGGCVGSAGHTPSVPGGGWWRRGTTTSACSTSSPTARPPCGPSRPTSRCRRPPPQTPKKTVPKGDQTLQKFMRNVVEVNLPNITIPALKVNGRLPERMRIQILSKTPANGC